MNEVELLSAPQSTDFPESWYEESSPDHFWFRWRLAALRRALEHARAPLSAPWRVLDVGCGSGVLAAQLEANTGWTVDGADLNLRALESRVPRRGRALYYDVTERRAELLERYDAAILFDVLEHVERPRVLLESVLAHLRPGGLLLVNVPALPALRSVYDDVAGHLRRYTRATLSSELSGLGLEPCALRSWGLSLVPLLAIRKLVLRRAGPRTIERGFRPPGALSNRVLSWLGGIETRLLPAPIVGTSVLYVGRKTS